MQKLLIISLQRLSSVERCISIASYCVLSSLKLTHTKTSFLINWLACWRHHMGFFLQQGIRAKNHVAFNIYEIHLAKFLELLCPLVYLTYNIAILNLKSTNSYILGSPDTDTELFTPYAIYRTHLDSHRIESYMQYFDKKKYNVILNFQYSHY